MICGLKTVTEYRASPMGLYAQSPDSQISNYLSTLLNALVNLGISRRSSNTFSFPVPSYVQVATGSTVYNPKMKNLLPYKILPRMIYFEC